jgi:hypothetical protein
MLPFEDIPVDLVPLTAYFKHLLTYANQQQPLLLFLDSVDQLTGAQDANKVSWLPLRLPPYCKVMNLGLPLVTMCTENVASQPIGSLAE